MDYPIVISPLSEEDGGGFVAYAVDLPGCMSDGDTPEEAAANIQDAIEEWLESNRDRGLEPPKPGSVAQAVRRRREELLKALNAAIDAFNGLDDRITAIERVLDEIQDNDDRWERFDVITGHAIVSSGGGPRGGLLTFRK